MLQSAEQLTYAATNLLITGEESLANYNRWIVDTILQHIPSTCKQDRVLDFGAGIGTLSTIFYQLTGIRPIGVEIDPRQKNILQSRGYTAFSSLSEVSEKFDIIFTSNVLEHIEDDVEVLRQLRARIQDDGVLAIYVPAFEAIWSSLDDKVGHYRRYTKTELTQKLRQSGFTVVTAKYCDSLGFFLSFLFKYIGNEDGEPSTSSLRFFDKYLLPLSKIGDKVFSSLLGKNVFITAKPL